MPDRYAYNGFRSRWGNVVEQGRVKEKKRDPVQRWRMKQFPNDKQDQDAAFRKARRAVTTMAGAFLERRQEQKRNGRIDGGGEPGCMYVNSLEVAIDSSCRGRLVPAVAPTSSFRGAPATASKSINQSNPKPPSPSSPPQTRWWRSPHFLLPWIRMYCSSHTMRIPSFCCCGQSCHDLLLALYRA